jgi:hypothetical protein
LRNDSSAASVCLVMLRDQRTARSSNDVQPRLEIRVHEPRSTTVCESWAREPQRTRFCILSFRPTSQLGVEAHWRLGILLGPCYIVMGMWECRNRLKKSWVKCVHPQTTVRNSHTHRRQLSSSQVTTESAPQPVPRHHEIPHLNSTAELILAGLNHGEVLLTF